MADTTPGSKKGMGNRPLNRTQKEVEASLVDGSLPCAVAFKIARKLKVSPGRVGEAADELGVRIVSCQLGCFP